VLSKPTAPQVPTAGGVSSDIMTAYCNEFDRYAAQWLRNLISAGHIAPGDVDERDIKDVRPSDLQGYTQCHFLRGSASGATHCDSPDGPTQQVARGASEKSVLN
jgi:hypothetical protein